jgi:cytochrome-b5 reductase
MALVEVVNVQCFLLTAPCQKYLPKPAEDIKLLICGPPPMVSSLKKTVAGMGYEKPRPVSKLEDQVFAF